MNFAELAFYEVRLADLVRIGPGVRPRLRYLGATTEVPTATYCGVEQRPIIVHGIPGTPRMNTRPRADSLPGRSSGTGVLVARRVILERDAALPRPHPRLRWHGGPADQLPPFPLRQVALGSQRPRQGLPSREEGSEQHRDVGDQQLLKHAGLQCPLRGVRTMYQHVTVAGGGLGLLAISIPSLRLNLTGYARRAEASTWYVRCVARGLLVA
jgi:hypothetical protein